MAKVCFKEIFTMNTTANEVVEFVKENAIKGPARCNIPQYSMQAVFEALVNTAAHRDYSIQCSKIRLHLFTDRLELFSPGTCDTFRPLWTK